MRKNKTMRGGFGFDLDTMKTLGRAGLNHAASNIAKGTANSIIDRMKTNPNPFTNLTRPSSKTPTNKSGMSSVDRFKSFGEGMSRWSNSELGKSILNSKAVHNWGNAALNSANNSRFVKGVANAHSGHGKPN